MERIAAKPQLMKKVNLGIVVEYLRAHPGATQPQIAEATGLSLPTVNKVVRELLDSGNVVCEGNTESTGGRRAKCYRLNADSGQIIGVYIQDNAYHCTVRNMGGETIRTQVVAHRPGADWMEELFAAVEQAMAGETANKVEIIGVAVPGTVTDGAVFNIPAIPEWEGCNLQQALGERYGCKVLIENDMNSATMGVCGRHLEKGSRNMVFISILNNIGASLVLGGQLYNGRRNFVGELAYMAVDDDHTLQNQVGAADCILQQAIAGGDTDKILSLICRILVNVCCVVDPDLVVLATPHLKKSHIPQLAKMAEQYILREFLPDIRLEKVNTEQYLEGLVSLCKKRIERPMRIVQ